MVEILLDQFLHGDPPLAAFSAVAEKPRSSAVRRILKPAFAGSTEATRRW
jgi:hypothetical protein